MSERGTRWIAVVGAAATLLVAVTTAVLYAVDRTFGSDPVSNVLALLAVACYAVVGGLLAVRLPRNACGWLLLVIGLGLVTTMCTEAVSTIAERDDSIQLASWALWVNSWLLIPTAWLGIVSYFGVPVRFVAVATVAVRHGGTDRPHRRWGGWHAWCSRGTGSGS